MKYVPHRFSRRVFTELSLAAGVLLCPRLARSAPSAEELLERVLEQDAWGLRGGEIVARAILKDVSGKVRELGFQARSRAYAPRLTKSLVRFRAPADLAGTGFLQVQKAEGDDERWLYLPELKRARRIAGGSRKGAFMGTDFSYADMDQRDLRSAKARILGTETLGPHETTRLEAVPTSSDAVYGRIEVWVRTSDLVPVKWHFYQPSGAHQKTLVAKTVKRIEGRPYIVESQMTSHETKRTTDLILDKVSPKLDVPDDEFSVRNLEKA